MQIASDSKSPAYQPPSYTAPRPSDGADFLAAIDQSFADQGGYTPHESPDVVGGISNVGATIDALVSVKPDLSRVMLTEPKALEGVHVEGKGDVLPIQVVT